MGNTLSCFDRYGRQPGGPLVASSRVLPPAAAARESSSVVSDPSFSSRPRLRRPSVSADVAAVAFPSLAAAREDDEEAEGESTAHLYAEKLKRHRNALTKRLKLAKSGVLGVSQTVTTTLSKNGKAIEWVLDGKSMKASQQFAIVDVYRTQTSRKNDAQLEVELEVDRKSGNSTTYTLTFQNSAQCQEWDTALQAVKQVWLTA